MHDRLYLKADRHYWVVIVRDGCVFRRYRTHRSPSEMREGLAAALCGYDLELFQIDPLKSPPPEEGTLVDPVGLGWVSISQRICVTDRPQGS